MTSKTLRGALAALALASAAFLAVSALSCSSAPSTRAGADGKANAKAGASPQEVAMEKARADLDIAAPAKRTEKRPLLMTHYMPWFEAPPISKNYGWHWHMGYTDPFQVDAKGYAQIATHYYPLTGPYDSTDKDLLEYQTLLMRIAGIDGVIIDWYGTGKVLDYPVVHKASQALFAEVKKAGLKFAVCYEDQSVGKMVEAKAIPPEQAVAAARESLAWVRDNWMKDGAYLSLAGRPLLLDFGPQYAKLVLPSSWDQVFAGMEPRPFFDTLDSHMESTADGSFAWPPMHLSGGGTLSPAALVGYLNEFYRKQVNNPYLVTSAFPGFHDFYNDAHVARSYGFLGDSGGGMLKLTLDAAAMARPDVVQLVTWNDYGEGTIIEPTVQKGYRELETVQDFRKRYESDFPYDKADLRLPLEIFKRRIDPKLDEADKARLDAIYAAVASGDAAKARELALAMGLGKR